MTSRRSLKLTLGAVAGAAVLVGTMTTSASAGPPYFPTCYTTSGTTHWYCSNLPGAEVEWAGRPAGYLLSDFNFFLCRYEGDPTGGGGPHPNRWIYTEADMDLSNGGWGFVKDSDIYSETNPLPKC